MQTYITLIVLLLLVSIGDVKSQSRWEKIYHDETDAFGDYIIETYDHGYFLLGRHGANYPKYIWLIKTDINGEVLWEKTIGDDIHPFALFEMAQGENGSIYLCGQYNNTDPSGNPIIMKFNECGEKLWCKEFHTQDNHDFASCLALTPDGGVAVTLNYTGVTSSVDRICLTRINPNGEILWINCYNSPDSSLRAEDDFNLLITQDKGFLITGFCYYEDPTHPNLYWPEPYYIKVDSLGNFQWETVVHKDDPLIGGQAWFTVISPDSQYYYSSISHYYYNVNTSSPALLKMDLSGNILGIYDIVTGHQEGKLFSLKFINDSLIACSAGWGETNGNFISMSLIVDTIGNISISRELSNDIYLSYVIKAFDNKLLFFINKHQQGHFDSFLYKFNSYLEDDTLNTFPFMYDSLCPYAITSDTIVQDDCDLIVGIEEEDEEMGREGDGERMVLYPNPASDYINCRLQIADCRSLLLIYDMFGRKQEEIQIPKGQKEIQFDVSVYPKGIYIAVLQSEREIIDRKKFVVK